tara:strand:- start:1058 stop:1462 length:405 start_codon:yes stop_codon:yes gene_type:complete
VGHKYKDKYTLSKGLYKHVNLILYKSIDYKLYYKIIKRFFEILIRDVVVRDRTVSLPNKMGYIYLEEKPHKRSFHVRVDNDATKETGKTVYKKIPILDDFYKKLVWVRPTKYRNCKILPLGWSKKIIRIININK